MVPLEDWLSTFRLTPADFGRNLGLKWPYSVRRYLRKDVNGRPRKDWRAPRADIQLQIERMTWGLVTPADWAKETTRRSLAVAELDGAGRIPAASFAPKYRGDSNTKDTSAPLTRALAEEDER
jgi:hypothetical protein